ncbi:MAG: 3'-5' exonuclease [Bacilli bacterium]
MDLLNNLNKEQKEAVMHVDGPCLVLAGAGSGKTKVLTTRIASLIKSGINSSNILAITFTNKAAKEMRERLNLLVNDSYSFVGTFHAFGLRILKENYDLVGLSRNFTIIDSDDVLSVIKKIMKDLEINPKECLPSFVRNKISFIKNEMLSDEEATKYLTGSFEKLALKVYFEYVKILKRNNAVDFDDLLKLPVELLYKNEELLNRYQEKYKYILIDEYQDTNEVQYKLVKKLAEKYRNLFVVGDSNQAIYAFRGSNYKNILNFEKDYPDALVISLNENYRSTNTILNAANSVIKNNPSRKEFALFSELGEGIKIKYFRSYDEKHEVTLILEEINSLLENGYNYEDIAILYRTNAQSRNIEEGMLKNNLPYKVVGSYYFYKRKEIKDLLAYLRLISNHADDVSLRRIINEPKRGIGLKSLEDLSIVAYAENTSMFDALSSPKELDFKNIILELTKDSLELNLTELIDAVLEKTGMKSSFDSISSLESDLKMENLMEFKSITESYQKDTGNVNLEDFLNEISLVADISEHKDYENTITLMTIHAAKGLEFKVVFLAGMEENLMPHSMSLQEENGIEEERRLCYVAITRAKERLYLSNAKKRMLYGNSNQNAPSRFITEIDPSLIDRVDRVSVQEKLETAFNKDLYYSDESVLYKPGDVVYHISFGRGVVTSFDDKFVSVAFNKRYGIKKFLNNYQGLRKEKK